MPGRVIPYVMGAVAYGPKPIIILALIYREARAAVLCRWRIALGRRVVVLQQTRRVRLRLVGEARGLDATLVARLLIRWGLLLNS